MKYHLTKQVPRDQVSTSWPNEYLLTKWVPRDEVSRDQASTMWPSKSLMTKWLPRDEVPRDQASARKYPRDQITSGRSEYLMTKQVPRDAHAQCYKWSQLLHKHYLQNVGPEWEAVGQDRLTTSSWLICSFPTRTKSLSAFVYSDFCLECFFRLADTDNPDLPSLFNLRRYRLPSQHSMYYSVWSRCTSVSVFHQPVHLTREHCMEPGPSDLSNEEHEGNEWGT